MTLTRTGQATGKRILEAATELIARQGVAGTGSDRGDLRPGTDVGELSTAPLAALQEGNLLGRTLRTADPMRTAMKAARAYLESFAAR